MRAIRKTMAHAGTFGPLHININMRGNYKTYGEFEGIKWREMNNFPAGRFQKKSRLGKGKSRTSEGLNRPRGPLEIKEIIIAGYN